MRVSECMRNDGMRELEWLRNVGIGADAIAGVDAVTGADPDTGADPGAATEAGAATGAEAADASTRAVGVGADVADAVT